MTPESRDGYLALTHLKISCDIMIEKSAFINTYDTTIVESVLNLFLINAAEYKTVHLKLQTMV